jgi:hypothetical protein
MENIAGDSIMNHLIDNKLILTAQHDFIKNKSHVSYFLETLDLVFPALEIL